jgi:hypothetical protein
MLRLRRRSRPLDEWTPSYDLVVGALDQDRKGAARSRGNRQ